PSHELPMYWTTSLGILTSAWLFTTPILWAHRPATSVLALLSAALGFVFSVVAVLQPRYRIALAVVGVALAFSTFFFPDSMTTMVHPLVAGSFLAVPGLAPEPHRTPAYAATPSVAVPANGTAVHARAA